MPTALIWGESLVGSGHARVQSELARALQTKGWDVHFITGSQTTANFFNFGATHMHYQPPLKLKTPDSDPYKMKNLVTPNNISLLDDVEYQTDRKETLLQLYHNIKPDVVITEMWPYARANFDFELIPLANAVGRDQSHRTPPPRLYSIARDIMFPPSQSSPDSPNLQQDRHTIAEKYFEPHSILARGDGNLIPLHESIGDIPEGVRDRIDYVGYFAPPPRQRNPNIPDEEREVLVSSGGGVTRDSILMFQRAIEARKLSSLRNRTWRVLIPHTCPEETFQTLKAMALNESPDGRIIVEHNRTDFPDLLSNAALLICHGGNTIIEAVSTNVPVLVIPRGLAKNNREQQIRAGAFHKKGFVELIPISEMEDLPCLAQKIDDAMAAPRLGCDVQYGGAAHMAEKITQDYLAREQSFRVADLPQADGDYSSRLNLEPAAGYGIA